MLWSAAEPDHWEDVASTIGTKVAALLCHSSQATTTMGGAHDNEESRLAFHDHLVGYASRSAEGTELDYAEAFKRITP
jgi:hypothetical protein